MGLFDGVNAPKFQVEFAWGGSSTVDPQAGYFILGTSQLDTGLLGTVGWQQVPSEDVVSLHWQRGFASEVDQSQPGSATIVLDNFTGVYDPLNLQSPYVQALQYFRLDSTQLDTGTLALSADDLSPIDVGVPVKIVAIYTNPDTGQDVLYPQFRGTVNQIVPDYGYQPTMTFQCLDGLDVLGRRKVGATAPASDNDTTGTRLGRLLDAVSWPSSLRAVDTGLSRCQPLVWGDFALPLAQQVVDTELGLLFIDGSGVLTFYDRLHVYTQPESTTVQAALTDDGSAVGYVNIQFGKSADVLYNEARLTRAGGTEQVAADATSVAQYGTRTFPNPAGSQLRTDADALSLGTWIVGRFKKTQVRVQQIDISAMPLGQWPTLLALELFNRIRAVRSYGFGPAGGYANTIDRQVLIQGMSVTVDQGTWAISLTTRMVDNFSPFVLGTSKLNTGTPA
jgi:hypothetical protein